MKVGDSLGDVESINADASVRINGKEVKLNATPDITVLNRSVVIHARAGDDPKGAGPRVACCKIRKTSVKTIQEKFNQMINTTFRTFSYNIWGYSVFDLGPFPNEVGTLDLPNVVSSYEKVITFFKLLTYFINHFSKVF